MKSCNCGTRNSNVVPEEAIRILHYWNHTIFGVIRQAEKKTEGKQSIPDSSMLVIQERIIQKCDSSAIQKSTKLLQVVNIPRVYLSCLWKKLKHQMTAGICADLMRKLWSQLSLNKRERLLDINTEPSENMQDLVKNISNAANTQESFRAQKRFCSSFYFPWSSSHKTLVHTFRRPTLPFPEGKQWFFFFSWPIIMARLPLM